MLISEVEKTGTRPTVCCFDGLTSIITLRYPIETIYLNLPQKSASKSGGGGGGGVAVRLGVGWDAGGDE